MVSDAFRADIYSQLEKDGEAQVRLRIASGNFPTGAAQTVAIQWLAQKDAEARTREEGRQAAEEARITREEATRAEELRLARSANRYSQIAIAAAAVAIVISVLAWLFPHAP